MPEARPSVADIAHRRKRVAEAYLRGVPQFIIARDEAVHKSTITRDLDVIREQWKTSASMAFGERVAQELAKLDELERTYWEAWDRSRKDTEKLSAKTVKDGETERTEAVKHVEPQPGDPRFLDGVDSCIDKRCKILGIYHHRDDIPAAQTANVNVNVTTTNTVQLADAELVARIAFLLDPRNAGQAGPARVVQDAGLGAATGAANGSVSFEG